jgi:REP element-mobilizing transposase RayT
MERPLTLKFFRRNLPHWLVSDRAYFVTIRLKGTFPKPFLAQMREEKARLERTPADEKQRSEFSRDCFLKTERILDVVSDVRWLDEIAVAEIVIENFKWFTQRGWVIYAAVLLSTHVHLLMRNENGRSGQLLKDLGQFKRVTAFQINPVIKQSGSFWAREDFDHWIRTPEKFESAIRYIANNPVKAGRIKHWDEWPWTIIHESVRYCLERKAV